MSSRLSINSRVANSSPRFFCLQEKQDFKTKDRACDSLALSRRSPHEEDEQDTGRCWAGLYAAGLFVVSGLIDNPALTCDLLFVVTLVNLFCADLYAFCFSAESII